MIRRYSSVRVLAKMAVVLRRNVRRNHFTFRWRQTARPAKQYFGKFVERLRRSWAERHRSENPWDTLRQSNVWHLMLSFSKECNCRLQKSPNNGYFPAAETARSHPGA